MASVSSGAVRVNLDGCLSSDSTSNCRGNDSILVYQGRERSVQEQGLQPFTGARGSGSHLHLAPPCQPPLLWVTNIFLFLLLLSTSEYLYRVTASHEGGSVRSDWSRGRTAGAGKDAFSSDVEVPAHAGTPRWARAERGQAGTLSKGCVFAVGLQSLPWVAERRLMAQVLSRSGLVVFQVFNKHWLRLHSFLFGFRKKAVLCCLGD